MTAKSSSTSKPYLHFIGGNAASVTGSCTIVRFDNIKLAVDMGLIQTNNLVADYRANRDQMKKIKPKTVHGVVITHLHADHCLGLLAAVAMGMQAYIYIPKGSIPILKIMMDDCIKIMAQDSLKMQNKHGIKAPPLATGADIDKVMQWLVEVPFDVPTTIVGGAKLTYYHAGHIIHSAQAVLEIKQGYSIKRIGFTGDFNTEAKSVSVPPIEPLPRCNVVVGECTYSDPTRCYSMKKDRWYDEQIINAAIYQYNRILMPAFSLQRVEDILDVLWRTRATERKIDGQMIPVYLDSPLAYRIYRAWSEQLDYEDKLNLWLIESWKESQAIQQSNERAIIVASSGMLNAGRALAHLKYILPNSRNAVLFSGYASPNTLAYEIKHGAKEIMLDGEPIQNNAQIYCLNTFSSHANYNQLMQYYQNINYDKLCLVHSEFSSKVEFANTLQDELIKQGKSSRVVATQQDQKIWL